MAMKIRTPEDVLRRNKIREMDRATVKKEIAKSIRRLNKTMRVLESSGYDRYSATYGRLRGYNKELGTHYFSSKHMARASLKERKEYLYRLQTYETYKGLKEEEVKESLEKTAEKLSVGDLKITSNDIKRINDYMEDWREFIKHSNIADLMESNEARSLFTNREDLTRHQIDMFFKELNKFNTGDYQKKDFDVFLKSYNYKMGRPVAYTPERIAYNPMNGKIYNDELKYMKTSLRISRSGEELERRANNKTSTIGVKLSSFDKESFYDYVFNDQKNK
jgi:hypothetical protein